MLQKLEKSTLPRQMAENEKPAETGFTAAVAKRTITASKARRMQRALSTNTALPDGHKAGVTPGRSGVDRS